MQIMLAVKLDTFCSKTLYNSYHNLRDDYMNKFSKRKIHFLLLQNLYELDGYITS